MMRRVKIVALALIALIIAPSAAQAFDIPLLTWERGREQQVVLGGGAFTQSWTVTMEGNGAKPLTFTASQRNTAGYVVYSVMVPATFPLGAYSIVTTGKGSPRTVVAGVNLIGQQTTTAGNNLFDLTLIIAIFVFLTGIVSTIRARKYLYIPFKSEQILPKESDPDLEGDVNFWDRLETAPYRFRVQTLNSLRPSLLRFLLIREGEVAHKISKNLYGVLPLIGFFAGLITGIEVIRNNGLSKTPITIFIIVLAIAVFDAFAGVIATLGFWAIQLSSGNITSIRDVLIALSVGIAWVGPSLFAALLRESINRDFQAKTIAGADPIKFLGVIGSSAVGTAVFYFGHALINSVLYTDHAIRSISSTQMLIVALMLLIRGFADGFILDSRDSTEMRDESFLISRVSSPITALLALFVTFAFVYIWTQSASRALFVAVIFALPYFLIFVRFNRIEALKSERVPRNILIESSLIAGITFIVFRQISQEPLLLDQRAGLLLLLTGVAPMLHSIYSAIYSSNEQKFSFDENTEIITP